MPNRVVVSGGGIAGASDALHMARARHEVVLVERSPQLGGLVVSFEVGGTPLECFYQHGFPHEVHIVDLISDLGLSSRLEWFRSSVGIFTAGRIWPFTSPLDLIRFSPLPLSARLHTGIGAMRMARVREWRPLDQVSAIDWL